MSRIRGWWIPPPRLLRTTVPLRAPHASQIRQENWRTCAPDLLAATDIYRNFCRTQENGKFSESGLRKIIRDGSELVRAAGGMVAAARQVRLEELTKLTETRAFIESTHRLYPDIASAAMSLYKNGADPMCEAFPAMAVPNEGYPHDRRNSEQIIESMWGEVMGFKAIVCARKTLIYSERMECAHKTSPPRDAPIELPATNREPFPIYVALTCEWAPGISPPYGCQI